MGTTTRWVRIKLRHLFVLLSLCGLFFAWVGKERRQSQLEQEIAGTLDGPVIKKVEFVGPFDLLAANDTNSRQTWWRENARRLLGERVFSVHTAGAHSTAIEPLTKLKSLKKVLLVGTRISDPASLAGLENVEDLELIDVTIGDLSPLSELAQVRFLRLAQMEIADIEPLARMKSLEQLILMDTNVSDLGPLKKLTKLKYLTLKGRSIRDLTPLAEVPQLQFLSLAQTEVRELTPLHHLNQLFSLEISATSSVSEEQVKAFKIAQPRCEVHE